jgi:hypothetical protein
VPEAPVVVGHPAQTQGGDPLLQAPRGALGRRPMEPVKTMAPPRFISGNAFWAAKKLPRRFTACTSSQSCGVTSGTCANVPTPALTNSTSMRPCRSRTACIAESMLATSEMSERMDRSPGPTSAATWSRVVWSRPVITTCAPSDANATADARPMPLLPPMTTTTLSLKRIPVTG